MRINTEIGLNLIYILPSICLYSQISLFLITII